MAPIKALLAAIAFSFLVQLALGKGYALTGLSRAQQCRLDRITSTQPVHRIEHEGGVTEFWDEQEDQFQCAGVVAIRNILRPNAIFLPEYVNAPRLAYVEQGSGLLGISFPGCAETYHSGQESGSGGRRFQEGEGWESSGRDLHQKVRRIRRGDIIAIPEGTVHWCHNDGNEDLVAVSIVDLNNQANQLDQHFRAFFLAGGVPAQQQQMQGGRQGGRFNFQKVFQGLDEQLLSEAYNVPVEIVRNLQREDNRGFIVNAQEQMRGVVAPEEDQEFEEEERRRQIQGSRRPYGGSRRPYGGSRGMGGMGYDDNGFEETFCTMKVKQNIETFREADVHSRQAGRINLVNMHKMPILQYMDMSAERGQLLPNALYSPHWAMTDHRIVYVTGGDAHIQIVGQNGQNVFDERVQQGSMFVIPQFFATVARAGTNGFEWITFKTSGQPMKSPLVGYTSVFRALPLQVISESYQISPREAEELKYNREHQTFLLSPSRQSAFRG